ncbi:MAG: alanine racemase [Clostridiales bacterium]|nr:alanine racemase [Candidatus Crickella caballi]
MYKEALRQVWAEIDMGAFDHNVKEIKKHLGDVQMIGVIKANGYGHGATECAKVLEYNGCDHYAVATLEEAVSLREDGIGGSIVVLGLTPAVCADTVVEYGITPVIMSLDYVKALGEAVAEAKKNGTFATAANCKPEEYEQKCLFALDTGMGRIGYRVFTEEERKYAAEQYKEMTKVEGVKVPGIITHFSTADEEQREYTGLQISNYNALIDLLAAEGIKPKKICANSAAIMVYPEVHFDAARPGIIMYGLAPSGYLKGKVLDLKPVMSVKAEILNLKTVPAGTSVSYGRKFTSNRESKIATIGLGYADGYTRLNSGKIEVLCGGKRCPVVGNICMDQCMVDVTEVEDVKIGDEIVVMGKQGDAEYSADDIAALNGTINYEVTCLFDLRLPKVYVNYPEGMCK